MTVPGGINLGWDWTFHAGDVVLSLIGGAMIALGRKFIILAKDFFERFNTYEQVMDWHTQALIDKGWRPPTPSIFFDPTLRKQHQHHPPSWKE